MTLFKQIMYYIIAAVLIIFFVVLSARWFEWSNVFFPSKEIENTPSQVGLEYEDIYFVTPDAATLNAWFIPADNPRGTVLFCHGNAGNISHRLEIIKIFNDLNLNVFIFDYRGYGRSKGWPNEKGTYQDAMGAYNYLREKKNINEEDIIVYGKSLGGAVAIDLGSKKDVRAVISDSSFTSTIDMAREIYPFIPLDRVMTIKYYTLSRVGKLKMPKLIIHSTDDEVVPFHHGEKIFDRAAEPKEFYRMSGGHNDAIMVHEDEYRERLDSFFKKHGI